MAKIMTVCGEISADDLGVTSMHDHVLATLSEFFRQTPDAEKRASAPLDLDAPVTMENLCYLNQHNYRSHCADNWELTDVGAMQREVAFFKARGGQAILEPSAPGIRTNTAGVRDISAATGVHIIASTGLYVGASWSDHFRTMSQADFRAYLKHEIEVGIDDTDIRAGHIKTGIRVGDAEEMKFIATSAEVSNETNLLITAHTSAMTDPERKRGLLNAFLKAGMNPAKLLLCHVQFTFMNTDMVSFMLAPQAHSLQLDWAKEILDAGVNICIDLFGLSFHGEDMIRLAGLIALLKAGYADQIVIGNDVYQKVMTKEYGGQGYAAMLDYALPRLREHGIDQATIDKITITNPARMLRY